MGGLQVMGLDPGFGNTKVATARGVVVLPSLVAGLRRAGLAASGLRLARASIVRVGGQEYAVGAGAPLRGVAYESIDDLRFLTAPAMALMLGAMAKAVGPGSVEAAVVVGLPVSSLQAGSQEGGIARGLRQKLLGAHAVEVDGAATALAVRRLWVRAQPMGVWAEWAVRPDGELHAGARRALVGIVDIGFHTLHLMGIEGGQAHLGMVAGAELGVRLLLEEAAREDDVPYHELLRRYAAGSLHVDEGALAAWASRVAGFIRRRWAGVRPQLVVLAGGGAALLKERGMVQQLRRAVRCDLLVPADPITAGARGLLKLGQALLAREAARRAHDAEATLEQGAH